MDDWIGGREALGRLDFLVVVLMYYCEVLRFFVGACLGDCAVGKFRGYVFDGVVDV